MKTKTKPKAIVHGECILFKATLPKAAVQEHHNTPYVIVADSETTGNHHVIDRPPGVEFFKHDKRRFMKNSVPTEIKCLHTDRHDSVTVAPGTWEIDYQQEYDYFTEALRNVRD
jgi:hypothetical protein